MILACALIILFSVGFVLPCMLDIAITPESEFAIFSKGIWLLIAGAFWIFGATAWLLVGRPRRLQFRHRAGAYPQGFGQAEAYRRHPAAQAAAGYPDPAGLAFRTTPRPAGPDDDPDFLLELDRRIRENREDSLLV
jgi:hypothetical protein